MRLTLALAFLAALPVSSQDSPTIKVTTRMVQVNVIVRDKKGPVSDLTKDDFTLLERGKPRKISSFSLTSTNATPTATEGRKMPPNVFSNRFDRVASAPNNVTIVLLDGLNTKLMDQAYARKAVIQFLESLERQDKIALYTLGSKLRVLHDFTSDFDQLKAAIARTKGENIGHLDASTPEISDSGNTELDDFLNSASKKIADFYTIDRVLRTTQALQAIASHVQSIPGRKNLIWVSGSFPFSIGLDAPMGGTNERRTFSDEVLQATRSLNAANLAVYPVDARGLIATPPQMQASSSARPRAGMPPRPVSFVPDGHDTMSEIAARTGGHAFYNTNDLRGAIRKAIEDAEVTYTLGFYPDSDDLDGKFHELKVKVARSGLDVRHRKGYLAIDTPPMTEKQMADDLRIAFVSPLDITQLGVSARADIVDKPEPGSLQLTLVLDARDMQIEKKDDKWTGGINISFIQVGPDQKNISSTTRSFNVNLTDENYQRMMKEGLRMSNTIVPAKDLRQMRIVVLDRASGKIGSLRMPLTQVLALAPVKKADPN